MKDFNDFRKLMKSEYKDFHKTVSEKASDFSCSNDLSEYEENRVYAEICSMALLEKYHKWLNRKE